MTCASVQGMCTEVSHSQESQTNVPRVSLPLAGSSTEELQVMHRGQLGGRHLSHPRC